MAVAYRAGNADVLTEVLGTLRIRGRVFCVSELSAPWSLELPAAGFAHFHVIERGSGWLKVKGGGPPVPLASGDLVIVPHGQGHTVSDAVKTRPVPLARLVEKRAPEGHVLKYGGGGHETHLICGSFQFEESLHNPILSLLPPLIHVRAFGGRADEWLELTLRLIASEARAQRQGSGSIITRLTDVIFVQAVRAWIEGQPEGAGGWLGALRDPQVGAALALVHRRPEHAWTVTTLAREIGMSRSPFSARFARLVGEPPLTYLANWRMYLAAAMLKEAGATVGEVARRVGYESEAAFGKAFKRAVGVPPGAHRRGEGKGRRLAA